MAGSQSGTKQAKPERAVDRLSASLSLDDDVTSVKLVSPARAKALAGLGVHTVRDMLNHFPRRYIDLSATQTIAGASIGNAYTIYAQVHAIKLKRPNPRMVLTEITLVDGTGTLIVTAFRQPWLAEQIHKGDNVAVAGTLEFDYGFKRMTNPFIEKIEEEGAGIGGRVIPVHPACEKISAAWMRRIIENALDHARGIYDPIPLDLRLKYNMMSRQCALACIHFPASMEEAAQARKRLAYEELLLLQIRLMVDEQLRWKGRRPVQHVVNGAKLTKLEQTIPFVLTEDQAKAKAEVLHALNEDACASHLVLGDVGTGKTLVAAFALTCVSDTGTQALFMAPTEVLAMQHYRTLSALFESIGVTCELLTGSTDSKEREGIIARAAAGTTDVLIGTHALLEPDVQLKNCSLVVIDEQQRFGVKQRQTLLEKGTAPDSVFLTATPIPRTLALAIYGNLTLSYLTQKPNNAATRTTKLLRKDEQGVAFDAARAAVQRGEQVYVVCPLIGVAAPERNAKAKTADEEQEDGFPRISIETEADFECDNLAAATKEAQYLQTNVFPDYRVELMHGSLSSDEKAAAMARFKANESQVLVSTTVIEVGVDIPNATVMIIEDADRFGLSQLHQLRGRVGRGEKDAEVFLVSASKQDSALERLSALEKTDDGFQLATYDLSLRREGDILGNRQHGASSLKLVNIARDGALIEAAHHDAREIIQQDPELRSLRYSALAREVRLALPINATVQGG